METKTKIIIGVGAVLTLGLVAYFTRNMWMPKPYEAPAPPPAATEVVPPTATVPVIPPPPPADNKEADRIIVDATTLLSGNMQSGKNKGLYAKLDGLKIFNMNNGVAFQTKKEQRVGTIFSAEKSGNSNSIWIYFIGPGGVKLKTVATGMNIK